MGEIGDAVWGKQVLELQAIDAGSVGLLDIIVIVVVVELVDDADAKRVGIGEMAIVDPGHIEVFGIAQVAFGLQDGVHLYEAVADKVPVAHVIADGFP